MELEWTDKLPVEIGYYLFQKDNSLDLKIGEIIQGRWEDTKNPEWLYLWGQPLHLWKCDWYGPIKKPTQKLIEI